MILGTLRDGTLDGELVVVHPGRDRFSRAAGIARNLQAALDDWERTSPALAALAAEVAAGRAVTEPVDPKRFAAPLPRAYEWVDGSAYLSHVVLARKARGAEPPKTLRTEPLVYQGGSGVLLGPTDPLELPDPAWGLDFEAEVAVVLGATPRATPSVEGGRYVRLVLLANDVTYRGLVPGELEKGFGFFCSKPATAFSPFAVTPDELGDAYREGRLHLRVRSSLNGALVGDLDAGLPMHFSFHDLIAHISKTRSFAAGTLLGSGTVSNEDSLRGVSCLVERRMREILETGAAVTPYLAAGDRVRIECLDTGGTSVFGAIDQEVVGR